MSDLTALLVAVLLLALNAFFVAAEFALVSSRRSRVEVLAAQGSRAARVTLRAMEQVSLVMAAAQLGITACSLGLGALGEPAVAHLVEPVFEALGLPEDLLHPVAFVLALAVVVSLHVVAGEMVPKNLTLAGPERAAVLLGPPMMVLLTVLRPVVAALNAVANAVLRLVGVTPTDEVSSTATHDELAAMVEESRGEGAIADDEYDRLSGALGFTGRDVASVLLPNAGLVVVPRTATPTEVEAACATTGFSRFPVSGARTDELVGYVHVKDVLGAAPDERDAPLPSSWVRELATVAPGTGLQDALTELRRRGAHLARVVEDGATLGVVTLEDVLEELVGEIRDAAQRSPGA